MFQSMQIPRSQSRKLRVFLCHSSGDKPAIRQLYRRLMESGYQPWLDEEDLIPGQNWQQEISKAVRNTDVVLICLSQQSVTKKGFVQKEITFALDAADERPEGTIFLIPARLSDCSIPDRLNKWHWVDLFDDRGYDRLLRSLRSVSAPADPRPPAVVPDVQLQGSIKQEPIKSAVSRDLFPLYGVTLGKTTTEELAKLGTRSPRIDKDTRQPYFLYVVNGVNFWYDKRNVADHIYIARGVYSIPSEWEAMGFGWKKSYMAWCETLRKLGFSVKEKKKPEVVKYQGKDSLSGEVTAKRLTGAALEIDLNFNYNSGNSVDSPRTLYAITVSALK
jgi:hypothetical protein